MKTTFGVSFLLCALVASGQCAVPAGVAGAAADSLGILRAIHIGGNWGSNPTGIPEQPPDYYQFLHELSVNIVGISICLHIENSVDSTVERV